MSQLSPGSEARALPSTASHKGQGKMEVGIASNLSVLSKGVMLPNNKKVLKIRN